MPDALDLDSIAAQMKAAAERAMDPSDHANWFEVPGNPVRAVNANWFGEPSDPVLAVRTDLTGARVVASNPAHILAILWPRGRR